MGAASSVLDQTGSFAFLDQLVWEYETSKAVMPREAVRKNLIQFIKSGKIPFNATQLETIQDSFHVCEEAIEVITKAFHAKWNDIVENPGQFRRHSNDARGNTIVPDAGGFAGLLGGGFGESVEIMLGGHDSEITVPEESIHVAPATTHIIDEHAASVEVNIIFNKLLFENRLPEYMRWAFQVGGPGEIKLKQSDRLQCLKQYIAEEEQLLKHCDEIESKVLNVVIQCIRDLGPVYEEGHSGNQSKKTDIVLGVSLKFLKVFLQNHPQIDENYSTGAVVYNIIIPETAASKETYVNALLLHQNPEYLSDLRSGYRRFACPRAQRDHTSPSQCGLFSFLSHAWGMPFLKLIEIAEQAARTACKMRLSGSTRLDPEVDDAAFFWIDVFCKNQHTPAPAMAEFRDSIQAPGKCVVALYPLKPLAISRIWCLYEIWTSVILDGVELIPTYPQALYDQLMRSTLEGFKKKIPQEKLFIDFFHYMADEFPVDANHATATREEDIALIKNMIIDTVGIDKLNSVVAASISSAILDKFAKENDIAGTYYCNASV